MNNVYVVMSSEQVDDPEDVWFDEPCRAFESLAEADQFMLTLRDMHRENKHYENTTRFFVKRIPFGQVQEDEL